jgi:hypothetical protein
MYKKKFIVNFVADNVPSSWVQLMPAVQKLTIAFPSGLGDVAEFEKPSARYESLVKLIS